MESASDPEAEENPDVWELFRHYDRLYFRGALDDAAFAVEWTSPRTKTCRCVRRPLLSASPLLLPLKSVLVPLFL
jgi:hypothetical protein